MIITLVCSNCGSKEEWRVSANPGLGGFRPSPVKGICNHCLEVYQTEGYDEMRRCGGHDPDAEMSFDEAVKEGILHKDEFDFVTRHHDHDREPGVKR